MDKKRSVEEIKAEMRQKPQQELAPLQAELEEAEKAEKDKADKAPEPKASKAKDYD